MAELLYIGADRLPSGERALDQLTELSLEPASVPTLAPSVSTRLQPLERDEAIARGTKHLLNGHDLRRLLAEPLERVAYAAQATAQCVDGGDVARSPLQAVTPLERSMGEPRQPSTSHIARDRRHDAECLDRAGKPVGAQGLCQPALRPCPLPAQACGPVLGRVLFELHIDVAASGGLVPEPPKVVVEHAPAA